MPVFIAGWLVPKAGAKNQPDFAAVNDRNLQFFADYLGCLACPAFGGLLPRPAPGHDLSPQLSPEES
jgi:hypothetical protein